MPRLFDLVNERDSDHTKMCLTQIYSTQEMLHIELKCRLANSTPFIFESLIRCHCTPFSLQLYCNHANYFRYDACAQLNAS